MEVRADVAGDSFYEVTFLARTGRHWRSIGTDDTAPYRVFDDVADLRPGTALEYRAVVLARRDTNRSNVRSTTVPAPALTIEAPAEGSKARDEVTVRAVADPDRATHVVRFERSVAGGPFESVGTDSSAPSPYLIEDDVSGLAPGTEVRYRAILSDGRGGPAVTSNVAAVTTAPPPDPSVRTATIHYNRPDGNYAAWGLHFWGTGIAPTEALPTWANPAEFEGTDGYGAVFTIDIADPLLQVGFIVHGQPPNENTKDTDPDRFFTPAETPHIWLRQGDTTVYDTQPETG
jgi:hypothetical protein